jgi:hypothetical protein
MLGVRKGAVFFHLKSIFLLRGWAPKKIEIGGKGSKPSFYLRKVDRKMDRKCYRLRQKSSLYATNELQQGGSFKLFQVNVHKSISESGAI